MEVRGYKSFNKNKQNRYGMPFTEGCTYRVEGPISFGNYGNGYHFCKNLCDVFRYADNADEAQVASVIGSGEMVKYDDEYYGYYDMYAAQEITIERFLSREEIISIIVSGSGESAKKFLNFVRLSRKELSLFLERFRDNRFLLEWIMYYQLGCHDIYHKDSDEKEECIRKVLSYGQDINKRCERK